MLYFALFHSNLLYCIGTLSSMQKSSANKIGKIQNKAIRSISLAKYREPTDPIYYDLKILPYNLLQKQAKLNFMHSVEYKYAPKSFLNTCTVRRTLPNSAPTSACRQPDSSHKRKFAFKYVPFIQRKLVLSLERKISLSGKLKIASMQVQPLDLTI